MTAKKPPADPAAKKPVDQATLDRLAAGRAKLAASKAASSPPPPPKKDDVKPDSKPAPTARPEKCTKCWERPCCKTGKCAPKDTKTP